MSKRFKGRRRGNFSASSQSSPASRGGTLILRRLSQRARRYALGKFQDRFVSFLDIFNASNFPKNYLFPHCSAEPAKKSCFNFRAPRMNYRRINALGFLNPNSCAAALYLLPYAYFAAQFQNFPAIRGLHRQFTVQKFEARIFNASNFPKNYLFRTARRSWQRKAASNFRELRMTYRRINAMGAVYGFAMIEELRRHGYELAQRVLDALKASGLNIMILSRMATLELVADVADFDLFSQVST